MSCPVTVSCEAARQFLQCDCCRASSRYRSVRRYAVWYQRGYQEFDSVTSATTTKLKGIAMTNFTKLNISLHGGVNGVRVWDVADYVMPPQVVMQQRVIFCACIIPWCLHVRVPCGYIIF
jgi:hypothetical protein